MHVKKGSRDLIKYLINNGVDIDNTTYKDYSRYGFYYIPLIMACRYGNKSVIKYLINNGADIKYGFKQELLSS